MTFFRSPAEHTYIIHKKIKNVRTTYIQFKRNCCVIQIHRETTLLMNE
jgi:hypothetical protein